MAKEKDTSKLEKLQGVLLNDKNFLKEIIWNFCQNLLEKEMAHHLQASPYQRTDARRGYRNGYKPHLIKTRVGAIELLVPQDRDGQFRSDLFDRYQRSEKALVASLIQMYIKGVSTRKVRDITEKLCGINFSKSYISGITKKLDKEISIWRNRPLEKAYPYIIVDALYEKIRINDKVVSRGVLIVIGVGEDGYREIISVDITNTETKESWSRIFRRLRERGLKGVKLIVSDNHKGLREAINRYFQEALWQRCQFHFTQNLLDHISKKNKGTLRNEIQCIFNSPDIQSASLRAREMVEKYKDIYPGFTERLEEGIDDALSCFHFPSSHRRKIRTTNTLERFNEEIRRRTRVVRIFPDEASCLRLTCALCIEKSEEWITKKRYMRMDVLYQDTQEIPELEGALIST